MKLKFALKLTLLFIFNFSIINSLNTCSCWPYIDHFCGTVNESYFVVRAEVMDFIDIGKREMKIIDNLNAEIPDSIVTIIGQDGINCGESLELFETGDTIIMGLKNWNFGDYYLDGLCGLHFLRYSSGLVTELIYSDVDTMSYQTFVDSLFSCLDFETSDDEVLKKELEIDVFPNPVDEEITISTSDELIDQVQLFSLDGKLIVSFENLKVQNFYLKMGGQNSGLFLLKIKVEGKTQIKKVVKQ